MKVRRIAHEFIKTSNGLAGYEVLRDAVQIDDRLVKTMELATDLPGFIGPCDYVPIVVTFDHITIHPQNRYVVCDEYDDAMPSYYKDRNLPVPSGLAIEAAEQRLAKLQAHVQQLKEDVA